MRTRKFELLAGLAIVYAFALSSAYATPIGFATDRTPGVASDLYRVDFGANTATLLGSTGFELVTGLAFQPGTGVLFGVAQLSDQLITINTSTGAGTAVGALGAGVVDVGLAFDASGNLYMSGDNTGSFYSVNPSTGAATLIGNTGTSGVVGLDFSPSGELFGLVDAPDDNLVTIDTTTGSATVVGALGVNTSTGGIAFGDGSLYGAFGIINAGLTIIDPSTGSAAAPTDLGIDFTGVAIASVSSVPEPSILAILGLGLAGMGCARKIPIA